MPSLISETEKNNLTGIFNDIFDTFKREIVIHKEPKKVISQVNTASLFGYGDPASSLNYSYEPVSGVFEATIIRRVFVETLLVRLVYVFGD